MAGPYWYGLLLVGGLMLLFTGLLLGIIPLLRRRGDSQDQEKRGPGFSSRWSIDYIALFAICVCFGVTWAFGLPSLRPLHLGAVRIVFQIVFVASNILLGILMVLSYCILSAQVRALYCSCGKRQQYPVTDDNTAGIVLENRIAAVELPPPRYETLEVFGDEKKAGCDVMVNMEVKEDLGEEDTDTM